MLIPKSDLSLKHAQRDRCKCYFYKALEACTRKGHKISYVTKNYKYRNERVKTVIKSEKDESFSKRMFLTAKLKLI